MILKALYDYYHRSGDDVAPFGLEYKEIGFKGGKTKRVNMWSV